MKRPHRDSQIPLPPMPVGKSEGQSSPFRKPEEHEAAVRFSEDRPIATPDSASALSAEIFTEALKTTRIGNVVGLQRKEVAELLGVSTNLVDRWCNPNEPACPSDIQMLCMPWAFHLARHRVMNKRFGFWRASIARVFESLGDAVLGFE